MPSPLQTSHLELGASFRDAHGHPVVESYGEVEEEYWAAKKGAAVHDASYRETLQLTGPDRVSFLHGMVSNEVRTLTPGASVYAALLTAKGAMVSDLWVTAGQDALWLSVEPGCGQKVLAFLGRYLISEEAELSDSSEAFGTLALVGPEAPTVAASVADRAQGVHADAAATRLLIGRDAVEGVFRSLLSRGLRPVGHAAAEIVRVEAGVPRYGLDMDDDTLPLEANLSHALSYEKGCYIGQEVVARMTHRGHANWSLAGFVFDGAEPVAPKTEGLRDGKKQAWVTSSVFSPRLQRAISLGYVHRDAAAPGTTLRFGAREGWVHAPGFKDLLLSPR